jgi:hypothetical protein
LYNISKYLCCIKPTDEKKVYSCIELVDRFEIVYPFNDNIITTSNYTQLQLIEPPGYNWNIVESGAKQKFPI